MRSKLHAVPAGVLLAAVVTAALSAQETKRDTLFRRLLDMPTLVKGGSVQARWMADSASFWYIDSAPDRTVALVVDPRGNSVPRCSMSPGFVSRFGPLSGTSRPTRDSRSPRSASPTARSRSGSRSKEGTGSSIATPTRSGRSRRSRRPIGRKSSLSWYGGHFRRPNPDLYRAAITPTAAGSRANRRQSLLRAATDGRSEPLTSGGVPDFGWSLAASRWSPNGIHLATVKYDNRGVHKVPLLHWLKPLEEVEWSRSPRRADRFPIHEPQIIDVLGRRLIRVAPGTALDRPCYPVAWAARRVGGVSSTGSPATCGSSRSSAPRWRPGQTPRRPYRNPAHVHQGHRFQSRLDRPLHAARRRQALPLHLGARRLGSHLPLLDRRHPDPPADRAARGRCCRSSRRTPRAGGSTSPDTRSPRGLTTPTSTGSGSTAGVPAADRRHRHPQRAVLAVEGVFHRHPLERRPAPDGGLRSAEGKLIRVLSKATIDSLLALGWKPPEEFVVKAADSTTDLHGVLFKPFDFDPNRKYPIIEYIYGGPQTVNAAACLHPELGAGAGVRAAGLHHAGSRCPRHAGARQGVPGCGVPQFRTERDPGSCRGAQAAGRGAALHGPGPSGDLRRLVGRLYDDPGPGDRSGDLPRGRGHVPGRGDVRPRHGRHRGLHGPGRAQPRRATTTGRAFG